MATISIPPTRLNRVSRTNQKSRKYYTIHSNPNNACTLKINENKRLAIVGFRELQDAVNISTMIETHYIEKKEWPDMTRPGTLILPEGRFQDLVHVFVREREFDDLKLECTRNILDMISVDQILKKKSSYSFSGNVFQFSAPCEFYQNRFNELFESE
jgi:hypothetical protein